MGLFVRTIGIARARTKIGMANLAYNLTRFILAPRANWVCMTDERPSVDAD